MGAKKPVSRYDDRSPRRSKLKPEQERERLELLAAFYGQYPAFCGNCVQETNDLVKEPWRDSGKTFFLCPKCIALSKVAAS